MFEKESEENKCAREHSKDMALYYESTHNCVPSQFEKYLRGAVEYGYRQAAKMHNLKKDPNDLPPLDEKVYLWCQKDEFPVVARRHIFTAWGQTDWVWECYWGSGYELKQNDLKIKGWQKILLPEEK